MCKNCEQKNTTPEKHMCLRMEDAKADIFNLIDELHAERKIPFFMLEGIVTEAARQVTSCADAERTAAMQLYKNQFASERGDGGDGV